MATEPFISRYASSYRGFKRRKPGSQTAKYVPEKRRKPQEKNGKEELRGSTAS